MPNYKEYYKYDEICAKLMKKSIADSVVEITDGEDHEYKAFSDKIKDKIYDEKINYPKHFKFGKDITRALSILNIKTPLDLKLD